MNKALLHRLATIERNQPEETFFTLCKRWRDVPESRKAIAEKMDVPFVAAEYACTFVFLRFCFPQSLWPYYTVEPIQYNRIGSKEKRIIYDLFSLTLGGG